MSDKKISALTAATTPLAGTEVLPIVQSGATVKVAVADLTAGRSVAALDVTATTVDTTNLEVTNLKAKDGTSAGSIADATGVVTLASTVLTTTDINGGTIDGATVGAAVASTGAFTTLSASSTVSGTGFSTYLASPPAIGGTTASTGRFTNVTATTGDFIVGTAGKGVDFSGAGTASRILDEYNESSWTVGLFDASSGGNQSATTVTGYYTRIGNMVTCRFSDFNNIDTTGMTAGNLLYFSLPFTAGSTGGGIGSCSTEVFAFGAGRTQINPEVANSAARGRFIVTGTGVANAYLTVAAITTGVSDIERFTLTYFTA